MNMVPPDPEPPRGTGGGEAEAEGARRPRRRTPGGAVNPATPLHSRGRPRTAHAQLLRRLPSCRGREVHPRREGPLLWLFPTAAGALEKEWDGLAGTSVTPGSLTLVLSAVPKPLGAAKAAGSPGMPVRAHPRRRPLTSRRTGRVRRAPRMLSPPVPAPALAPLPIADSLSRVPVSSEVREAALRTQGEQSWEAFPVAESRAVLLPLRVPHVGSTRNPQKSAEGRGPWTLIPSAAVAGAQVSQAQ